MMRDFEIVAASAEGLRADALKSCRKITSAREIPTFGREYPIGLVNAGNANLAELQSYGVFRTRYGLKVAAKDPFAFAPLEAYLPVIAKQYVKPFIVDVPITVSPASRLDSILTAESWRAINEMKIRTSGACNWCGSSFDLQARECWDYQYAENYNRVGQAIEDIQLITGLLTLCKACYAASNVDISSSYRDSAPRHLDRLYQIFRVRTDEERLLYQKIVLFLRSYRTFIDGRGGNNGLYRTWAIDLSRLASFCEDRRLPLTLKRTLKREEGATFHGRIGKGTSRVTILGVSILPTSSGFELRRLS